MQVGGVAVDEKDKPYGAPGWNRTSDPQLRRDIKDN
jgi:hypothetical protein